jgi:large subunit ribosomal protein L13
MAQSAFDNLKIQLMSNLHFTTKHANAATVQRQWHVVDGTNQTVGRMCAKIAAMLRGKHKASYTPHVDTGDYIIVINCEKVVFTGNKQEQKLYDTFSGYPGGRKEETAESLLKRRPEVVIERAVKGMLPKNRLGRQMYKKLFVYAGAEHPHKAQQPKELKF